MMAYPFHINNLGRTAQADWEQHIRQLIEQVLLTAPGERVNSPDFGSGVLDLVFSANSDELIAASRFMVQANLQQWLGNRVKIEDVQLQAQENQLQATVLYVIQPTQVRQIVQFQYTV